MHDIELVEVFDSSNNLMEEFEGCGLLHSLVLDNEVKKLATISILHDQVELLRGFYDFIKLNDVWVPDHFQDVDFSCNSFDIINVLDFIFFKNFDSNSLTS